MNKQLRIGLLGVLFLLGVWFYMSSNPQPLIQDQGVSGKALIGGDFALKDQYGKVRTAAEFKNKYMLIYFGYSYCPDICPTGLGGITRALTLLGPLREKIQPIFITIDPERDTVEHLNLYMQNFDPAFIALTGTAEQIEGVKKTFKVFSKKRHDQQGYSDYLMDHSSFVYVMGPGNTYLTHFTHATPPQEMAEKLKTFLK